MYRVSSDAGDRFLKVVRKGWFPGAEAEAKRMTWARAHVPVPEILHFGVTEDATWFISRAIAGENATDERFRSDVPALVQRLAVETIFLESYGVGLDEDRCQYYRLLYDVVS